MSDSRPSPEDLYPTPQPPPGHRETEDRIVFWLIVVGVIGLTLLLAS